MKCYTSAKIDVFIFYTQVITAALHIVISTHYWLALFNVTVGLFVLKSIDNSIKNIPERIRALRDIVDSANEFNAEIEKLTDGIIKEAYKQDKFFIERVQDLEKALAYYQKFKGRKFPTMFRLLK